MTKTQASKIRSGIIAANQNEDFPQGSLARRAYLRRSLKLIEQQTPARLRGTASLVISTRYKTHYITARSV